MADQPNEISRPARWRDRRCPGSGWTCRVGPRDARGVRPVVCPAGCGRTWLTATSGGRQFAFGGARFVAVPDHDPMQFAPRLGWTPDPRILKPSEWCHCDDRDALVNLRPLPADKNEKP